MPPASNLTHRRIPRNQAPLSVSWGAAVSIPRRFHSLPAKAKTDKLGVMRPTSKSKAHLAAHVQHLPLGDISAEVCRRIGVASDM